MGTLATPHEIAGHAEALRRLAHALVRDAAAADDAVQETLVAALATPPRQGATTGAWMKRVLRNVVRKEWRTRTRRTAREAAAPTRTPETPPQQLTRIEEARVLVEALRGLHPDKRTALELRYFEGLPPRAIAARLDVPLETVKTRLKRARAELRDTLTHVRGDRWAPAFVVAFGMTPRMLAPAAATWTTLALSKFVVAALLCVGLLIAGWMLWPRADEGRATVDTPQAAAGTAPAHTIETADARPTLVGIAPTPAADPPPTARKKAGAGGAAKPAKVAVTGRIELVDEQGARVPISAGVLRFYDGTGNGGRQEDVAIHDGRFAYEMLPDHKLEFAGLVADGRAAVIVEPKTSAAVPEDKRFVVRARLVPPTRVRVRDARTREELPAVLVQRADHRRDGFPHPGTDRAGIRGPAPSPVRLAADLEDLDTFEVVYRVGSPGYAWQKIDVRVPEGREHLVDLEPAGALTVRIEGPPLKTKAHVRIYRLRDAGRRAVATFPLVPGGSTIRCDALAAGARHVVRVEVGKWFSRPLILGQVEFLVAAGATHDVTLRYEKMPEAEAVRLAGEVHIPKGWPLKNVFVILRLIDRPLLGLKQQLNLKMGKDLKAVEDKPRTFRFDAGTVQAGRYQVVLRNYQYRGELVVGPGDTTSARIDVPPPVQVRVDVAGDHGGRTPFLGELSWYYALPKGVTSYSLRSVKRSTRDQPFTFQAPVGTILVRPADDAYHAKTLRIEVTEEGAHATLTVQPTGAIWIRVYDGDKQIPWDWEWPDKVVDVAGEGTIVSEGGREEARQILVDLPGRYRISLGPIDGYEPIEDRDVDVTLHGTAEVRIDLTRDR